MALVADIHRRADAHGFTTEAQVARFIDLAVYFGPDFGRPRAGDWWSDILAEPDAEPDRKLDALEERGSRAL